MSSPFVGEWIIKTWSPDEAIVVEGIPRDAFQENGLLTITQPDPDVDSFSLQWSDPNQGSASVSDLHSESGFSFPVLQGLNRPVQFPNKDVRCDLTLSIEDQKLHGTISVASSEERTNKKEAPDTGSGTFTATASGGTGFRKR